MKNIAVITLCLYSGGAERQAGYLTKYLSNYYNVYLFLQDTSNIVYEYEGHIVDVGFAGYQFMGYFIEYFKKEYKIDCAISFLEKPNLLNILSRGTEKIIISQRCTLSPVKPVNSHHVYEAGYMFKYADVLIGVSEGVSREFIDVYGINEDKVVSIYNFIDKKRIDLLASERIDEETEKFIGDNRLILNIGRLETQKNQKRLIVQFNNLVKKVQNVKMLILGSGKLEEELRNLITSMGLEDKVRILSFSKNPYRYLRKADAFALTSHFEGLPNVLLEAMYLEKPIVAVDCESGPRELLNDENEYYEKTEGYRICKRGILVCDDPTEDTGETAYFADALKDVFIDSKLEKRIKNNEKQYMESYSNEDILRKWISVIEAPYEKTDLYYDRDRIDDSKKIYIYGAGFWGKRAYEELKKQGISIEGFVVSDKAEESILCQGKRVIQLSDIKDSKDDVIIMLGTRYGLYSEIIEICQKYGFMDIRYVKKIPDCI